MTDPQFWPTLPKLLDHRGLEDVFFNGTSPVMVRTRDGRRIPATEPSRADGQPGEPG